MQQAIVCQLMICRFDTTVFPIFLSYSRSCQLTKPLLALEGAVNLIAYNLPCYSSNCRLITMEKIIKITHRTVPKTGLTRTTSQRTVIDTGFQVGYGAF